MRYRQQKFTRLSAIAEKARHASVHSLVMVMQHCNNTVGSHRTRNNNPKLWMAPAGFEPEFLSTAVRFNHQTNLHCCI